MESREILRSEIITLYLAGDALEIIETISSHDRNSKGYIVPEKENIDIYGECELIGNNPVSVTVCRPKKRDLLHIGPTEIKTKEDHEWDPLLLWFRPSLCCIDAIGCMLVEEGLKGISSVGCGSGLLEWLIAKLKGVEVTGYEVNEAWWTCPYRPPKFIPHVYADVGTEIPIIPAHHALFFCYFNNGPVFQEYLDRYEGNCLIIIGSENRSRRTDPRPLHFVSSKEWQLRYVHAQPSNDLVCCYTRNQETRAI